VSDRELDDRIDRWLRGTLEPDERAAFEERLRHDSAARRAFRRAAWLDASLRDWASRDRISAAWRPQTAVSSRSRVLRFSYVALALAACVALALAACVALVAVWWRPRDPTIARVEQTDVGCAVVTQLVDVDWSDPKVALRSGDTLATGKFALKKGLARIEFFSGATLILEGPAELDVISSWEAVCVVGKVRVRVPPAAQGFRLRTPDFLVVDRGTEFGAEVDPAKAGSRVHVFDGEVEAHSLGAAMVSLKRGEGMESSGGVARRVGLTSRDVFVNEDRLRSLGREKQRERFSEWKAYSSTQHADPRLIAYYPMQRGDAWDRLITNATAPRNGSRDGGAVGVAWSEGRWPGKDALEFKRPGDRVRLNIDGTYDALTFACWVKVDGLDRKYNALLLTDGYEAGEPHWQIHEDGRLMFSLTYPEDDQGGEGKPRNRIYFSPVVFDRANTGRWHHIAVTYDNRSGAVVQYVDGVEVSREVDAQHRPNRPIVYGACELGNWGIPWKNHPFPIRNLNGRLDEFSIYSASLSAPEIQAMCLAGRPD